MTKPCPYQASIRPLLSGELAGEKAIEVEEHLLACDYCLVVAEKCSLHDPLAISMQQVGRLAADSDTLNQAIERGKRLSARSDPSDVETVNDCGGIWTPLVGLTPPKSLPRWEQIVRPPELPDEIGRLNGYRLLKVIGIGGMGVVFRAEDMQLGRIVALKAIKPELSGRTSARDRFLREARAVAKLDHRNVVRIFHVGCSEETPFIAMELLTGESLQERIEREKRMDWSKAVEIGQQIAAGLAAAHDAGLIHRDIKPDNIWIEEETRCVKILDFGLAHAVDEPGLTQAGTIVGTPRYMSPEQATNKPVDHRSDLFSLGAVLYTMCSGRPPFAGDSSVSTLRSICDDEPDSISESTPKWLEELILQLLKKAPDERLRSAAEVERRLSQQSRAGSPVNITQAASGLHLRQATLIIAVLVLMLGISEAIGVTNLTATIVRLAVGSGTLVIEANDPDVRVEVNGEVVSIRGTGVESLSLHPGEYEVAAIKDGKRVSKEIATIVRDGRTVVRLTLEAGEPSPADDFLESTADLLADELIKAVVEELIRLNPQYDGSHDREISDGKVVLLTLPTGNISDLTPLEALRDLKSLNLKGGPGMGKVSDLSPLHRLHDLSTLTTDRNPIADLTPIRELPLTRLECLFAKVDDLTVLREMPLEHLIVSYSPIQDLTPLKNMPLQVLFVEGTEVADLSPLRGMRLRRVGLYATKIDNIDVLTGMPVQYLNVEATNVTDLTPMKDAPLTQLIISGTKISDLTPLKAMQLVQFNYYGVPVTDVSVLKDMPLEHIWGDFRPERDEEVWRSIPTLKSINRLSPEQFWNTVNAGAKSNEIP